MLPTACERTCTVDIQTAGKVSKNLSCHVNAGASHLGSRHTAPAAANATQIFENMLRKKQPTQRRCLRVCCATSSQRNANICVHAAPGAAKATQIFAHMLRFCPPKILRNSTNFPPQRLPNFCVFSRKFCGLILRISIKMLGPENSRFCVFP